MDTTLQPLALQVVAWGFVLAFVFGAVANRSNFCIMGALSDVVTMDHWGRMRMWLLAIAVATLGATLLSVTGQIDLSRSITQRPTLAWLSLLVGGLSFGVGMTLAGGCANKNLVRMGGGSVRSMVVLVFVAIASYMTLKGLFGQWRASLLDPVAINLAGLGWPDQSLATAVARLTGVSPRAALTGTVAALVLALLIFVFKDKRFRANLSQIVGGVLLGALVIMGFNSIFLETFTNFLKAHQIISTENVFTAPGNWKYMLFGLALILMMRFRPEGLLPSRQLKAELRHEPS